MTTGEGGMITTEDHALAERARRLINHGQSQKYLHTEIGYNFRMTDMSAAVGLIQLDRLEPFNEQRIHNAEYFDRHLEGSGLVIPSRMEGTRHVYHQYVVRVPTGFVLQRDAFMRYLQEQGIGTAVHYPIPVHRQPVYLAGNEQTRCPVSDDLAASVVSLPVHPSVTDEGLAYMCEVIRSLTENA